MLDIINNALRNNNYYICMYEKHVYIYNYEEIISFNNEMILIKVCDFKVKVKGNDLHIKKMEHIELLIFGNISGVMYE